MTSDEYWIKWYDEGHQQTEWGYSHPGWYFWDESETNAYGPYTSKELAREAMRKYCEEMLG